MEEKLFFEHNGVKVTNTRFISGGQTFAMSNITSVKSSEEKPKRLGGVLILLIGLVTMASLPIIGGLISAAAIYYLIKLKPMYHIMLSTSGGESSALKTDQKEYLNQIVTALNEAIIYRG